eukprot:scaffold377089_cov35-Attheya_sp.AAC.1
MPPASWFGQLFGPTASTQLSSAFTLFVREAILLLMGAREPRQPRQREARALTVAHKIYNEKRNKTKASCLATSRQDAMTIRRHSRG